MDFLTWLTKHWTELVAAFSIGGGSGLIAKKFTDKKQDKKISALGKKVQDIDIEIIQLKNDISTNTQFDKQFREQMGLDYSAIKSEIGEVKKRLETIIGHLLNK